MTTIVSFSGLHSVCMKLVQNFVLQRPNAEAIQNAHNEENETDSQAFNLLMKGEYFLMIRS